MEIENILSLYAEKEAQKKKEKDKRAFWYLFLCLIVVIIVGTVGYSYLFGISLFDGFFSASMILTAIESEIKPVTTSQKSFVIAYSLLSVILLLSLASKIFGEIYDIFLI